MFKKILLTLCICLSCFSLSYGVMSISASDDVVDDPVVTTPTEEEIISQYESGYVISVSSHMPDTNLYSLLLRWVKNDIKEKYDIDYTGDVIYSNMFKTCTEISIDKNIIDTLQGLELIEFDSLQTLKITNNKLTEINEEVFENMPVLKTIDFSSNIITSVDFGKIPSLENLYLSNNLLTSIDLTDLGVSTLNLNIAQNNFTQMLDIKFPERVSTINLNIINNKIAEIDEEYFSNDDGVQLSIGAQGLNLEGKLILNTTTPVRYYRTYVENFYTENLVLNVYKFNGKTLDPNPVFTFKDEDIESGKAYMEKSFGIGEYAFEYAINSAPAYNEDDPKYAYYKTGEMKVIPTPCDIKYEFKGEITDTFDKKVTGKVKVHLSSVDNGTIMYKVNSGDWQTGDTVTCDQGGNYTIYTKVVIDGVESEEKVVLVRTSQNVLIPDIVMLVLVLLFTFVLFMFVVPFVSKKFFKK